MPPLRKIVVVDHAAPVLKAAARTLQQAGYEVSSAANGNEALRHVRADQPDLILVDVVLPDMSGSEVLREIRADASLNGIIVVLVSTRHTTPEQQAEGFDLGADDFITLPMTNVELLARVRSHFRQRELTERLRDSEREQRELAQKLDAERQKLIAAQMVGKIGSWETDFATLSVSWSLETHRIFETSPDEFQPTHEKFLDRVHPDDREAVAEAFLLAASRNEPCTIEHRLLMPDGRIKHVEERWAVSYDENHQPVSATGTCQDISDRKHVEEESRSLAERLTTTLESITDAFFTVNPEWRFTFINGEAERLFGRNRADLIGREIWSEFPATAGSKFESDCRRAMDEHQTVVFEEFFLPLNIWIGVRAYPSELGLAVYFRDVSARRQAEEALRTSAAEFRTLAEAMPQIVWVTRADGWNIYFNQRWVDYTGLTLEESLGHGWNKPFHPDDQERAWRAWQHATATDSAYSIECRLRRSDGVYSWWLIRGVPLKDSAGTILKWFGTCTDIEELKRAQDRIAEQAALIDEASDAIIVRDLEHRILSWSKGAERLHGWRAEEAIGQNLKELLQPEATKFEEARNAVQDTGVWNGEIRKTSKHGVEHILNCRWTLLRDAQGQPKGILSLDSDVTEQKKIEQQFLRAQRIESIGTLAGGIAHDLNNLLAPITMGVELLKAAKPSGDTLFIIDSIERSAQRAADLVKQVLAFARGVEGSRVALQVRHIVHDLESILENTFPKNISVEGNLDPDLRLVMADPTQLSQVLLNLCVNARDAMPHGGRLAVSARNTDIDPQYAVMDRGVTPGKYVLIEVADSGCGMPRHILDRIFEPFFTTKEFGKGTGLGLSTVQGIMRSHGGFVNVYSELGKGTVFKVYLPALPEGAVAPSSSIETRSFPRGHGETIMVVDDEVSILEITQRTLQAFGYKVLIAEDGAHAIGLYAIHRQEIAVVVTDMMMPIMDGQALILALRRVNPQVRIIAASGLMSHDNLTRAAASGVKDFLAKPYSAEAILTLLEKVLREADGDVIPRAANS